MVAIGSLLAPSGYAWLLLFMLAYGMVAALFDVAINDEATAIERESGRALMSGFHGMFSLGGMAGAASWSGLASTGARGAGHLASNERHARGAGDGACAGDAVALGRVFAVVVSLFSKRALG